ncbi:DUF3150 domain-containing protein [Acidihalobacter ferrooxydans]|uniref:DUF3150 domain-containing protein n=1 Tax=Acidihalobacter ferrooxydans TaxID=1765967 RepID=A0A1P8UF92_9GAMM|nr:DUF3150 domain-containing protein [Acidihalobacter ferrooxydans]APZ42520.1 hypothetical protein BW247_04955 [Acidihalobacter ferrooxydans]
MKVHVFNVAISLVSPSRLAGEKDIKRILGIDHIPQAMKPLLRQSVLPQEAINPLAKQRGRARALLMQHATRSEFFGWVINPGMQSELLRELEAIKSAFYTEKQHLLDNYEHICEQHLAALRESCDEEHFSHTDAFIQVVSAAQPSKEYLDEQLTFEYLNPKTIELVPSEEGIVREGVLGSVLHEVAQRAAQGDQAETPKAKLSALNEISRKVKGLAYIAPQLHQVSNEIETLLLAIPRGIKNKEYSPIHALALTQALQVLSDEARFQKAVKNNEGLFGDVFLPKSGDLLDGGDNTDDTESITDKAEAEPEIEVEVEAEPEDEAEDEVEAESEPEAELFW